jgi:hypothetical protein
MFKLPMGNLYAEWWTFLKEIHWGDFLNIKLISLIMPPIYPSAS